MSFLAALLLATPVPTTDPVRVYEDWSVTCDNLAYCVAISADLGEPAPVVMRILRGGDWERLPDLRIHLPGEVAGTVSLRLAELDPATDPERRRRTHFRLYRTDAGDYAIAASDAQAFFHAARAARIAQVSESAGADIGTVPLSGLVAAMDRFDHVQARTGTVTGIYSRGGILVPLAAMMPPPMPLLHPVEGSPEPVDSATASRLHQLVCGTGAARHADDVEVGAMADRTWIAGIDCGLSGLNPGRVWLLLQADGSFSRAIFALPYLGGDDTGFGYLENSHFDPETGVMEALALQREAGDCGTWHRWQWSPEGFRLLEARLMRVCVGLAREHWPHVWRAQRVGSPPQTEGVQGMAGTPDERPAPRAVQEYGDWSVACDNARQCVAVSVSRAFVQRIARAEPGDLAQPKLWVRREAGPLAAVRVIVDTRVWGEATGEGPPSLVISTECDFDCLTLSYPMTRLEPGLYELAPADAEAFLIETQYGQRAVTRFPGGEEHSIVSTDGLSAALRWIDETQQQAGTVTAVLAYGETAASTVPPPPERPMVPVVRAIADQEFALVDRPDLAEWQRQHCRATTSDADLPVQQFLLGNGQALWSLPCGSGPYREVRLWLVESDAGELGLHLLPRPDVASVAEPPVLRNSRFDMQSGMLTSNSGGLCGWQRRWAWTGQAFAMIDSIEMPACHDILPHNWLQTYRAVPD